MSAAHHPKNTRVVSLTLTTWLVAVGIACAAWPAFGTPSPGMAKEIAPSPSGPSREAFGHAWFTSREDNQPARRYAWVWPADENPRHWWRWRLADPNDYEGSPPGGGLIFSWPAVRRALTEAPGGARMRELIFRLGLEAVGEVRVQAQPANSTGMVTQGAVAWPKPVHGVIAALGPAQPLSVPDAVPRDALGFLAASVSPGRVWQQLENLAATLWPLEATLVGTQITGWEQDAASGALAADIFGYQARLWAAYWLPSRQSARIGLVLPMGKPAAGLQFLRWACEFIHSLNVGVTIREQRYQGQRILAVTGLNQAYAVSESWYMTASDDAVFITTQRRDLLAAVTANKMPGSPTALLGDLWKDAPKKAVAFMQLRQLQSIEALHPLCQIATTHHDSGPACLLDTAAWLNLSSEGLRWQTQTTLFR